MSELIKCKECGRSHFGKDHRKVRNEYYRRYGKCKFCGRYIGNSIYDYQHKYKGKPKYHLQCEPL